MDTDTVLFKRYVYTIWGFFGELIGLEFTLMTFFAKPLIAVIITLFSKSLNAHLI